MTDDNSRVDARTVYSGLIEDIRSVKLQQWHVSYYCMLLLAGTLSLKLLFNKFTDVCCVKYIFTIISFLICSFGCYSICSFQKSLARYRGCVNNLKKKEKELIDPKLIDPKLIDPKLIGYKILKINEDSNKFWYHNGEYVIPFCFAIITAGILVILAIWNVQ